MTQDCEKVLDWLSAQADGELEAAHLKELEAHLETCAACRAAQDSYRAIGEKLRSLPLLKAPPEALRRVRQGLPKKRSTGSGGWRFRLLLAASLTALVGFGSVFYQRSTHIDLPLAMETPRSGKLVYLSAALDGELDASSKTGFQLVLDSGSVSTTVRCRVCYDREGDGKDELVEEYREFRTDSRPGWETFSDEIGLEKNLGAPTPLVKGKVRLELEHDPKVNLQVSPSSSLRLSQRRGLLSVQARAGLGVAKVP